MHTGNHYKITEFLVWTRRDIYVLFGLAVVPTVLYQWIGLHWIAIPWVPIAMIGTAAAFIVGFKNTLKDFPDIAKREELNFMIVKANYLLALNSIESKKEERLKNTSEAYIKFIDTYPQSQYLKEAEEIYSGTLKELKKKTNSQSI